MKTLASGLLVASALVCLASVSSAAGSGVKISQVYGGGGSVSATATYNQDYVELFNSSGASVNIGGWTVEYGSATGNWGSSAINIFTFPANTILPPCTYLLMGAATATGGTNLPISPDFVGTQNLSGSSGKVALFNAVNTNLACGFELAGTLVDKVAYGTGSCAEGVAVPILSVTTGAVRNGAGTVDTDSNVADFTVTIAPVPRHLASPKNPGCTSSPALPTTWGAVKSTYR